jgi:hypothetical protein
MAGSQVAIFNARNNRAKTLTSSDQITASFVNGMSQIMANGTNTGNIQVWDTGPMTQLIEAECADCAIAALGYSKRADFFYVLGVDGHVKYIHLGRRRQ